MLMLLEFVVTSCRQAVDVAIAEELQQHSNHRPRTAKAKR